MLLRIESLGKTYHGLRERKVLRDVSLVLDAGEYVAVMGESGIGKSTLLNLVAGLDTPDSGRILLDDRDLGVMDDDALTRLRRDAMGFVFQAFHILPYLSVAQNVALPLMLAGAADTATPVRAMLEAVSLGKEKPRCEQQNDACYAQNRRSDLLHSGEF